jgi:adenylate kinase
MKIIIFGAPGVGKGTQAKILSKKLHVPHISTGDILRSAVSKGSELGAKARAIMERGDLVPDELMGELIRETLSDKKNKDGFILDGFPRTLNQALILDHILEELGDGAPLVISLETDDETIINRLSKRRECGACHNIVNLNYLEDSSKCPFCGSRDTFIKRKDDEDEVIKNRLKVFHETTSPVLEHYDGMYNILRFEGNQPVETVTKSILEGIRDF